MKKRVAYQGISGSFSSKAAQAMFGADITPVQTTRFREIFEHVINGSADIGVVAIENALAGSIHENYDLLAEYDCSIIGEYYCPVQLHLMVAPGGPTSLANVTQVLSHPKALEQCSIFLEQHPHISPVAFSDTAGAALQVKQTGHPTTAAIASQEAAETYGLTVIAPSIQDHTSNMTRFFAVAGQPLHEANATKSSLILSLRHEPASLYKLLGEFAALDINVTKIESRPISGKPFEYSFHIDIERTPHSKGSLVEAVERAKRVAVQVRALGFYSTVG